MALALKKLFELKDKHDSNLIVCLSPRIETMPVEIQRYDEPFLPFGKSVINATSDAVIGYIFDLPAYMALGAVGIIALERTINYVKGEKFTILHGSFSLQEYTQVMDENAFGIDAVTISDRSLSPVFSSLPHKGAFVVGEGMTSQNHAIYDLREGKLLIPSDNDSLTTLSVLSNDVILAYRGFDYEKHLRERAETIRQAYLNTI